MTTIRPVKNHTKLFRESDTGGVFTTDAAALKEYKARKQRAKEFEEMKKRHVHMEDDIREIKELVYKVLAKYDHR